MKILNRTICAVPFRSSRRHELTAYSKASNAPWLECSLTGMLNAHILEKRARDAQRDSFWNAFLVERYRCVKHVQGNFVLHCRQHFCEMSLQSFMLHGEIFWSDCALFCPVLNLPSFLLSMLLNSKREIAWSQKSLNWKGLFLVFQLVTDLNIFKTNPLSWSRRSGNKFV